MRGRGRALCAGLAATVVLPLAISPSAGASAVTGGNAVIIGAPPSVLEHVLVDPVKVQTFFESEQVLTANQGVDLASSGTYNDYTGFSSGTMLKGTCVDSWLMHFDPGGLPPPLTANSDGSVTFDTQIQGVDVLDGSLDATDSGFGALGTMYPTGTPERGMEVRSAPSGFANRSGIPDRITLSPGMTSIDVYMDTGAHFDQARVFTACVPTTTRVVKPADATPGVPYSFTANVTSSFNGSPTGTVDFYVDGSFLGSTQLNAKHRAKLNTPVLWPPGVHTVQAVYEGAPPAHGLSQSNTRKFTVI